MRTRILLIHAGVTTDRESAKTSRRSFNECGYELDEFSLSEPEPAARFGHYLAEHQHELAFFFGSNAWAFVMRNDNALLHTFTGIPLVMMMHDHPIYFRRRMSQEMNGILVFAPDEYAPEFIDRYYPPGIKSLANIGSIPHFEGAGDAPSYDDFAGRQNAILCPINLIIHGMNIDGAWENVRALPVARRERAIRLIDAALYEYATPLHVISDRLTAAGDPDLEIEDLRWVLNFVKLWRRNTLIRALIELPMLIGSEYVPGDLAFRYPEKFRQLDWADTIPLYRQYRFVLNLSPLTHTLHDRVTNALFANAVCVTDPGALIARHFQDERDMIFVDLQSDIKRKLIPYLEDPALAYRLTENAYHARRATDLSISSYRALVAEVEAFWAARPAVV